MKDVIALLARVGLRDIRTAIQSGNLVFTSEESDKTRRAATIGAPIKKLREMAGSSLSRNEGRSRCSQRRAPKKRSKACADVHRRPKNRCGIGAITKNAAKENSGIEKCGRNRPRLHRWN